MMYVAKSGSWLWHDLDQWHQDKHGMRYSENPLEMYMMSNPAAL